MEGNIPQTKHPSAVLDNNFFIIRNIFQGQSIGLSVKTIIQGIVATDHLKGIWKEAKFIRQNVFNGIDWLIWNNVIGSFIEDQFKCRDIIIGIFWILNQVFIHHRVVMIDDGDFFWVQSVPGCHVGQLDTFILEGPLVEGIEGCLILDNQIVGNDISAVIATICLFRQIGQGDVHARWGIRCGDCTIVIRRIGSIYLTLDGQLSARIVFQVFGVKGILNHLSIEWVRYFNFIGEDRIGHTADFLFSVGFVDLLNGLFLRCGTSNSAKAVSPVINREVVGMDRVDTSCHSNITLVMGHLKPVLVDLGLDGDSDMTHLSIWWWQEAFHCLPFILVEADIWPPVLTGYPVADRIGFTRKETFDNVFKRLVMVLGYPNNGIWNVIDHTDKVIIARSRNRNGNFPNNLLGIDTHSGLGWLHFFTNTGRNSDTWGGS